MGKFFWVFIFRPKTADFLRTYFIIFIFLCAARAVAQPPGQKALPLPNGDGVAWLVDKNWFDPKPPFLEFYNLQKKDGLDLWGNVRLHLEDRRGFMWMSNRDSWGLFRYDGHEFKVFGGKGEQSEHLLDAKEIECVAEDEQGLIWIGCQLGLTRFDPKTEHFRTFLNEIDSSANINGEIFIQKNGNLWYGSEKGSFCFDREKGRFTKAFFGEITDANNPAQRAKGNFNWAKKNAFEDTDGLIWSWGKTPLGNGLVSVDLVRGSAVLYPLKTPFYTAGKENPIEYEPWLMAFCADRRGENLWMSGWRGGLRRFNIRTKRWTQFAQNYVSKRSRTDRGSEMGTDLECTLGIAERSDGKLWLTSAHGLMRFDPATMRFEAWQHKGKDPAEIPYFAFTGGLKLDSAERLWLSLTSVAVHDPARQFFERRQLDWRMPDPKFVLHDPILKKTWFSVEQSKADSCGIVELDEATGRLRTLFFKEFFNKKINEQVRQSGLARTGDTLWLASEPFLAAIDLRTGKLTKTPIFIPGTREPLALNGIAVAPDGTLWLSAMNPKRHLPLVHFFPKTGKIEIFGRENGLTFPDGSRVLVDKKGRVWLTSNHTNRLGVNRLDPTTGEVRSFVCVQNDPFTLPHNQVNALLEDPRGRIWMATNKGLCFYEPGADRVHRVVSLDFEYKHLALDGAGQIWATGDACIRLDPATGRVKQYGHFHGMNWHNEPMYSMADGSVGFGAFYRANPSVFPKMAAGPVVHLTGFEVFNKPHAMPHHIDFVEKIELPSHDNFFTLLWSSISLTNPTDDSFFYQLQGIDTGWVARSNWVPRTASYTKIPPGSYLFEVKCRNRDGVFGPVKTLPIVILPAWWQTFWFKLLVAGLVGAVLFFLYKNRLRQIRLESDLKQKEAELRQKEAEFQKRISEAQMSALRAQMNPHFIFNSLNSINRFIQLSEPDAASDYLTKFSRLIRLVLDNSRLETISLESELETGRLYLEMESLRFAGQFFYEISIAENVETSVIEVPPMLVQPYLENAIWHGLMQKAGADRRLEIHAFLENEDLLVVQITDNGIGRAAASSMKSKTATQRKSHGMDVTAERIALFQQSTGRKISIFIEDIKKPDGSAGGTSVRLEMGV